MGETDRRHDEVLATDTATGLAMSDADWLRIHYQACAVGYAEQLAFCRFEPGSRLVDVGSGPGLFLPALARVLGPGGEITACDISGAHLALARATFGEEIHGCRIRYQAADAVELPFPDGSFDGYWTANVAQYLDDEGFRRMLAEARRTVRSGGRVAVKEWDAALFRVEPSEPGTAQRLMEACRGAWLAGRDVPVTRNIHRAMTCSHIRQWLTAAGLEHARQHSTLIQFQAPLDDLTRSWCERMLRMFAQVAIDLDGPDLDFWRQVAARTGGDSICADPDFLCTEGSVVGVALVP